MSLTDLILPAGSPVPPDARRFDTLDARGTVMTTGVLADVTRAELTLPAARRYAALVPSGGDAPGKVVLVAHDDERTIVAVHQVVGGAVAAAWCGNGMLAAAAATGTGRLFAIGPAQRVLSVEVDRGDGTTRQRWNLGDAPKPFGFTYGEMFWISRALNDYVFTVVDGFDRAVGLHAVGNPKFAMLCPSPDRVEVAFGTRTGMRSGAPFTGVIELGIAVAGSDDLRRLVGDRPVFLRDGTPLALPVVEETADGLVATIEMDRTVRIDGSIA